MEKAMTKKLEGKVAVVTGAGSVLGMGREIAKAMAGEGAKVVVNDIGRDKDGTYGADKVVEEIKKAKGVAVANYDSVATMKGGENIIKTAISNFGRIDILVNTAGNVFLAPFPEITGEQWDSIIDVHLKGHFSCSKAAAVHMMKQKSRRIINFSSRGGFSGSARNRNLAYSAAKAGIIGFTMALSSELKKYHITVNCIIPSAATQLFPGPKSVLSNMPLALAHDPDYVAPIVVYLAADEAKEITSRFFYAAGGDICVYAEPFVMVGAHAFIRKMGKWTVDEIGEAVPPMLAMG